MRRHVNKCFHKLCESTPDVKSSAQVRSVNDHLLAKGIPSSNAERQKEMEATRERRKIVCLRRGQSLDYFMCKGSRAARGQLLAAYDS